MALVAERVYEGESYYQPILNDEYRPLMRELILHRMVQSTKADPTTITAIGDKTPAHSFHIDILRVLFPEARFIHMLRDGRDVAVSAFHHKDRVLRKIGKNNPNADLNQEAPSLLHKWAEFTRAVLKAEDNGQTIHTVRYELMLVKPAETILGCLQYIVPEIKWDHTMVKLPLKPTVSANKAAASLGKPARLFLRRGRRMAKGAQCSSNRSTRT